MVSPENSRVSASGGTKSKAPRLRWTEELHRRFVHVVERLGGEEKTRVEQNYVVPNSTPYREQHEAIPPSFLPALWMEDEPTMMFMDVVSASNVQGRNDDYAHEESASMMSFSSDSSESSSDNLSINLTLG
nr:transcription repressor KAN1-like [Ipomoea batatas]